MLCTILTGHAQDRPISYTAKDSIVSSMEEGVVELYNEVEITFGQTKLQAGYAKIYWKDQLVEARGHESPNGEWTQYPVFEEGGRTFYLKQIKYNWNTEKAWLRTFLRKRDRIFQRWCR